jgi:hypothetical protein
LFSIGFVVNEKTGKMQDTTRLTAIPMKEIERKELLQGIFARGQANIPCARSSHFTRFTLFLLSSIE